MDIENTIKILAAKIKKEHGKINLKSLIGRCCLIPEVKQNVREWIPKIQQIAEEVENLDYSKIEELASQEINIAAPTKKEEEIKGPVIVRFAIEPGGYMHIGNLRALYANYIFKETYGGKLILRFDDTNPEKVRLPYYKAIEEDIKRLDIEYDDVVCASERIETYYRYAKELIKKDLAYVCTCDSETMKQNRNSKIECSCRKRSRDENLELFEKMISGEFNEGEVVLRIKTDMAHKNPIMRDPVIFKISKHIHPITKYDVCCWPTYNFQCAIDDSDMKITHIIRGKDLMTPGEIQKIIQEYLGLHIPKTIYFGRLKIEGIDLGKRHIREKILSKEIESWSNPQTFTTRSLLERGITPKALYEFYKELGIKGRDISIPIDILYARNREIIDKSAKRIFFVRNPVEIELNIEPTYVEVDWHPEVDMGKKKYLIKDKIYIEKEDFGKNIRLKHAFNLKFDGEKYIFDGFDIKEGLPIIHWVNHEYVEGELIYPDGSVVKGYFEYYIHDLNVGEIIQLERIGYGRIVKNEGCFVQVYFAHK